MCIITQSKEEAAASCASMLATLMVNSKVCLHLFYTHSLCVYYSIAGNICWRKISRKYVQALQKKFSWFLFSWNDYMMLCMTIINLHLGYISDTEQRSEEASLCNNGLVFLLCVEALKITKASGLLSWGRKCLVEQKNSALLISTLTTSEYLLRIHLYSSRLIL